MERVRDPKCVYNLAGQLPLSELPGLLTRCALFIGNDSGPKHIAAGLGVPTIGIHSGAVDPYEYGPSGVNALSIMKKPRVRHAIWVAATIVPAKWPV